MTEILVARGTRGTAPVVVNLVAHAFLALVIILNSQVDAKDFRVLDIAWLSNNGTLLADTASLTSSLWIPLAIKHFNERSNQVLPLSSIISPSCNATLSLVDGVRDDAQSPQQAMREFIARSPSADIILGPVLSMSAVPVAVAASALGLPQVSLGASADELSNKANYPTFYRLSSTDSQVGASYAELFDYFEFKKIGLIAPNNDFGMAIKTALQTECLNRGIELFVQEYKDVKNQSKLEEQAFTSLKNTKTLRLNVIVYAATRFEFIYALAKAGEQLDWVKGKFFVSHVSLASYGTVTPEQIAYTYTFLNGSVHIQPTIDLTNPLFLKLREAWPKQNVSDLNPYLPDQFKVPPNYFSFGQEQLSGRGWAWAYDSVIAIGLAVCGPSSKSIVDNLLAVKFQGTSGLVEFDPATNDRYASAFYYTLSNLLVFDASKLDIIQPNVASLGGQTKGWNFSKPIYFNTGSTIPPKDTDPPVNEIDSIPLGAKIYGWIGSAIALMTSLAAIGYVIKNRKQRIIVESQPMYLALLAVGGGLMAISIIALTIESDGGCMGFPWLFSAGLTLAMASLTVKSARIAIYWGHPGKITNFQRILGTRILPACMWFILLGDLVIMLAWQLTAPWVLTMVVAHADEFNYPVRSSLVCTSDNNLSSVFIGLLIAYMLLVALVTGWVSFRVRNAPRRYHEAKMTALAGVSMFQVLLVSAPAAFAVWLMPLPRFLVLSSMSFLLCMIILVTMFAPKVFKVKFLGSMAAKTAANKRAVVKRSVTINAQPQQHLIDNNDNNSDSPRNGQNDSGQAGIALPQVKPAADWKLMILGIRSETDFGQSDSESPPDHDYPSVKPTPNVQYPNGDSPPEREHRSRSNSISPPSVGEVSSTGPRPISVMGERDANGIPIMDISSFNVVNLT